MTAGDMEAFRAAPGGCELHVLPCSGHFAAYEQPKKVASLMVPWLRQFAARLPRSARTDAALIEFRTKSVSSDIARRIV